VAENSVNVREAEKRTEPREAWERPKVQRLAAQEASNKVAIQTDGKGANHS
jgi:hypothetical protein